MNGAKDHDSVAEREFCGKILSVSFTLLGLLTGFYGVIVSGLIEAGPWKSDRTEFTPFLGLLSIAIVLDCLLGILAVLGVAGYFRMQKGLTILSCVLLGFVGIFVVIRSLQLLFY
jgi:hypothetical protein